MTKTRGMQCRNCGEIRWIDPKNVDPGCPCGFEIPPDNQLRVTGHFKTPIALYSIALHPDEIAGFRRKCPDVEVATDGPMVGIPMARTRQQKLRALRTMGFQEN